MQTSVYTLPEIQFVGGSSKQIKFNLKTSKGIPYNGDGAVLNFSIVSYSNKSDIPLISKQISISQDLNGVYCIATVNLDPDDTKYLSGKFVYQITVVDEEGNTDIPNHGIFYITRNISPNIN